MLITRANPNATAKVRRHAGCPDARPIGIGGNRLPSVWVAPDEQAIFRDCPERAVGVFANRLHRVKRQTVLRRFQSDGARAQAVQSATVCSRPDISFAV